MKIKNVSNTTMSFSGTTIILSPGEETEIDNHIMQAVSVQKQIAAGNLEVISGDTAQRPSFVRGKIVTLRNVSGGLVTVLGSVLYPGGEVQVDSKAISTGPVACSIENGLLEIVPEAEPAEEPTDEPTDEP